MYYELTPAYGQDYETAEEVKEAWENNKDFVGDHQLGFSYINKGNIPKPCTITLRYNNPRTMHYKRFVYGAVV